MFAVSVGRIVSKHSNGKEVGIRSSLHVLSVSLFKIQGTMVSEEKVRKTRVDRH